MPEEVDSLLVTRALAAGEGDCANASGASKAQIKANVVCFMMRFRLILIQWTCWRARLFGEKLCKPDSSASVSPA
ncbi:MAG: hypothetical protein DLM52_02900 [Chthoniobacterales bacterium]|nr:MAG: hypothetical protein DLM52_02900 [Chthoniobacterales bacterium]